MKCISKSEVKNTKGITLIALVITIILLLILAGVALNVALGDNGLISKSKQAVDASKGASERESLQMALAEQILDSEMGISENTLGTVLYDKTLENGNKWSIVSMNDDGTVYGTGWTFVEKGTNLPGYGELKSAWLISSEGKMIELEDNSYTKISFGEGIGTTDGLMFNLDSSIVERNSSKEELEEQLGNNVELINFDWNENSGINNGAFILDGVDDYIRVKLDENGKAQLGQRRIYI